MKRKDHKTMLAVRLRTETARELWRAFVLLAVMGGVVGILFLLDALIR